MSASHYLHGAAESEQRRLSTLNAFINAPMLRELNLRGDETILDLGSGLGQFSRDMARAVRAGGGRVVAIERDPRQLAEARRQVHQAGEEALVEMRQGDALAPPLRDDECGGFDLANARFLLEHVPDPLAVVKNLVRAVRPGGRIVLADDDHELLRVWPPLPVFDAVWRAYYRTYGRHGNDPLVGRKLVVLLHEAGAKPARNTWVFFGSCAGHPLWSTVIENVIGLFESARADISADREAGAARLDHSIAALREWSRRADAALWYAIAWAEGVKPKR